MATNTTNCNLSKPAYTDTADIAVINSNMDKVDTSLQGLADAIAIVAKNNTHAAITAGQYVYVHGHGSLAEGLYTAKSNIAANATLSTSNLQADGSGGLNALNSNKVEEENCGTANSSNTLSVSMSNNERSIIVGIASHERRSFMVLVYVSGSGSVTIVEINKGNNITLTTGTNTISVASSDTNETYVFKMKLL